MFSIIEPSVEPYSCSGFKVLKPKTFLFQIHFELTSRCHNRSYCRDRGSQFTVLCENGKRKKELCCCCCFCVSVCVCLCLCVLLLQALLPFLFPNSPPDDPLRKCLEGTRKRGNALSLRPRCQSSREQREAVTWTLAMNSLRPEQFLRLQRDSNPWPVACLVAYRHRLFLLSLAVGGAQLVKTSVCVCFFCQKRTSWELRNEWLN